MRRTIGIADPNASLAVGFAAGVTVSCVIFCRSWMLILVLAAAICLGVIVVWALRKARRIDRSTRERLKRRLHRPGRKRPNQGTATKGEPVTADAEEPDPSSEDFVAFHDFDAARGRFDHW